MRIDFKTDNAAFGEDDTELRAECARILHDLADRITRGITDEAIDDINGNIIGTIELYPFKP